MVIQACAHILPSRSFLVYVLSQHLFFVASYYDTHYEIYAKCCKEAGIQPHSCCIPAVCKAKHEVPDPYVLVHLVLLFILNPIFHRTLKQYGFQHEECHPPFTKDNLLNYVMKLVVEDNQVSGICSIHLKLLILL